MTDHDNFVLDMTPNDSVKQFPEYTGAISLLVLYTRTPSMPSQSTGLLVFIRTALPQSQLS